MHEPSIDGWFKGNHRNGNLFEKPGRNGLGHYDALCL